MRQSVFSSLFTLLSLVAFSGAARAQDPFATVVLVDQTPITEFEVQARIDLINALSNGGAGGPDQRSLVIDTLIEEAVQLNQARAQDLFPSDDEVEETFANIAAGNTLTVGEFETALRNRGVEVAAFKLRLRAQVAWNKVLSENVRGQVTVSDEEFDAEWADIQAARGQQERLLTEVFLQGASRAQAQRVAAQMRADEDFASTARALSRSPTAAGNGDLGWVRDGTLGNGRDAVVRGLQQGNVSNPVAGQGGQFIYAVRGVRPVGTIANATLVNVQRLFVNLETQGESPADTQKLLTLQNVLKRVDSCERFAQATEVYGEPGSGDLGFIEVSSLPPQAAGVISALETNTFSSLVPEQGGASIYIKCGERALTEPLTEEQVRNRMINTRVQDRARDLLINYRRQAYIEYM